MGQPPRSHRSHCPIEHLKQRSCPRARPNRLRQFQGTACCRVDFQASVQASRDELLDVIEGRFLGFLQVSNRGTRGANRKLVMRFARTRESIF